MATQDSYPNTTNETNDTNDFIDTSSRTDQKHSHNSSGGKSIQENLEPTSSRRTTMIMRPLDHSGPPIDNPNNSPETNAQLRMEYERVKQLNHMMETIIKDFQQASNCIESFHKVMDDTDRLLDLWVQILKQTQQTKRLLEDPSLEKKETPCEPQPLSTIGPTAATTAAPAPAAASKITTTTIPIVTTTKRIRAPAPVGTHMTKKLKTPIDKRRIN